MEGHQTPVNNLFSKILTGNASEAEKDEFTRWLSESEANLKEFHMYEKIWENSGQLMNPDLQAAIIRTEKKIIEKQKKGKRNLVFYWQKIAAVLIVPVLLATVFLYLKNREIRHETVTAVTETIRTPYGARTSFSLPDGSYVWLNSGSEISYLNDFSHQREITMKGEIYLEVKKGSIPFIVRTGYGNIRVMGTRFNVNAYSPDQFRTTLVEGSVCLEGNGGNVFLKPGFRASLDSKGYKVEKADTLYDTSWKDGKLVFNREPFELVAKKLERWFNVTIELKGEKIKKLWYTGTIEMESFTEVLELIKNTTPIIYSYDSRKRILTIQSKI